jgi:hypothetical protein
MSRRTYLRNVVWSTALSVGAFAAAWAAGCAGLHVSVMQALGIAVYSYVFWAYGFAGLVVTDFLLYLGGSAADYVPPPINAFTLSPGTTRDAIAVSLVHCLSSSAISVLVWRFLMCVPHRGMRVGALIGACLGCAIGVAIVLPHGIVPTPAALDSLLALATTPVNVLFDVLGVTVPIADNRLEMPLRSVPRLVGGYVATVSVTYACVTALVAWMSSARSGKTQDPSQE